MIKGTANGAECVGINPVGLGKLGIAFIWTGHFRKKRCTVIITWGGGFSKKDAERLTHWDFIKRPGTSKLYERILCGSIPTG